MKSRYLIVTALAATLGAPAFSQVFDIAAYNLDIAAAIDDRQDPSSSQPASDQTSAPQDARDRIFYPGDTERAKPLARKLLGNIWLDQKEIWTSPFHMHKSDAAWWLGIGGLTAALIATDHQTSNFLENSKGQVLWGNRVSNIGSAYSLIPIVAGFYTFGILEDNAKARETAVLGGEALLDSLIVVSVLKPIAGRNRPNAKDDPGNFFDGGQSFPSGHAINAWAMASVIAHQYSHHRIVPILAYGLASTVVMARVGARQHFPGDVVAGSALGWFIGDYTYGRRHNRDLDQKPTVAQRFLDHVHLGVEIQ